MERATESTDHCIHGKPGAWCLACQESALPKCASCRRHAILNFTCFCGKRFCSRYCMEIVHPWSGCRNETVGPFQTPNEMASEIRTKIRA